MKPYVGWKANRHDGRSQKGRRRQSGKKWVYIPPDWGTATKIRDIRTGEKWPAYMSWALMGISDAINFPDHRARNYEIVTEVVQYGDEWHLRQAGHGRHSTCRAGQNEKAARRAEKKQARAMGKQEINDALMEVRLEEWEQTRKDLQWAKELLAEARYEAKSTSSTKREVVQRPFGDSDCPICGDFVDSRSSDYDDFNDVEGQYRDWYNQDCEVPDVELLTTDATWRDAWVRGLVHDPEGRDGSGDQWWSINHYNETTVWDEIDDYFCEEDSFWELYSWHTVCNLPASRLRADLDRNEEQLRKMRRFKTEGRHTLQK